MRAPSRFLALIILLANNVNAQTPQKTKPKKLVSQTSAPINSTANVPSPQILDGQAMVETKADQFIPRANGETLKINFNLQYHANPFTAYGHAVNASGGVPQETIAVKDAFINQLGIAKTNTLWASGEAKIKYTPEVGAAWFLHKPAPDDADQLKIFELMNRLEYSNQVGNIRFGSTATLGYTNAYQWMDGWRDNAEADYKRTLDHYTSGIDLKAEVAVTDYYLIDNSLSFSRSDYVKPRYTFAGPRNDDGSRNLLFGEQAGLNFWIATINNKFILNKNLALSIPLAYAKKDYINRHAYRGTNFNRVDGTTRQLDTATVGLKANITVGFINLSTGFNYGRVMDQVTGGEDSNYLRTESSLSVDVSDKIDIAVNHDYESFDYDDLQDDGTQYEEIYQNYGASVTYKRPLDGVNMDAVLSHSISVGREDSIGFDNNATSLNLNFKL